MKRKCKKQPENRETVRGGSGNGAIFYEKEEGMYARESFTIAEVADLLSIRRLSDSYQDEFPVECPFCGDLRGKCSFCICKNGELKNVYHCYHCGASGNMLTLYAELSGIYGRNRYKEAYREIRQALSFSGTDERQQATTRNGLSLIHI